MNTKLVMTFSAVTLLAAGVAMTFIPNIILNNLDIIVSRSSLYLVQIIGALYFSYGLLNFMSKASIMGGIYNRPIAMGNFSHFLIAGLALLKGLMANPASPVIIWIMGVLYGLFAIAFGIILFTNPVKKQEA